MPPNSVTLQPITNPRAIHLGDDAAARPASLPEGDELEKAAKHERKRIRKLQAKFYADGRFALLVIVQGRDASGKDGVVKGVFSSVNPMGCEVTSFKVPSETEQHHDFLWRVHQRVPARGMIGIFNRSHYEDVLVTRVHEIVPKKVWSKRFDQINEFEHMLTRNSVVILKFFLHVSRDEQKKRLNDRLDDRKKNWKFRAGDLDDRAMWDDYTAAFKDAIARCSTSWAPWFVVPADDEEARNYLVAQKIADTLDELGLKYPPFDPKLEGLKIK